MSGYCKLLLVPMLRICTLLIQPVHATLSHQGIFCSTSIAPLLVDSPTAQTICFFLVQDGALRHSGPIDLALPSPEASVVATCVHSNKHMVLWSDGTLQCHTLSPTLQLNSTHQIPAIAKGSSMAAKSTPCKRSREPEADSPSSKTASLVALGDNLIAALTVADASDGRGGKRKLMLSVLDLQYGTVPLQTEIRGWRDTGSQQVSIQVSQTSTDCLLTCISDDVHTA